MSISICRKHDVTLLPIDTIWGLCPIDGEKFILTDAPELYLPPGASWLNQSYDPVWGASSLGHVREIREKYGDIERTTKMMFSSAFDNIFGRQDG